MPASLPRPGAVLDAIVSGLVGGDLLQHVRLTVRSFLLVMAVSLLLGVALGTAPGLMPGLRRSVEPLIGLALTLPLVTYFAVLLVLFGYGFVSVFFLGVLAATPTMLVSTVTALGNIDPLLLRVGLVYCGSPWMAFRRIVLPASLPTLASGVRIAAGLFQIPDYYAIVFALAMVSYAVALAFGAVESKMTAFSE